MKTRAKTQNVVAKSSAEAELYGPVRGSCEGLGVQTLYSDFGKAVDVRVFLEANAAKGIIERRGLCKVGHTHADFLWLQDQQARRLLPLSKVQGSVNPADLMTKNLPAADIREYLAMLDASLPKC